MQLQLKPLYVRNKDNPDEIFYSAMIIGTNLSLYQIPQPLIPIIGVLLGGKWLEASQN